MYIRHLVGTDNFAGVERYVASVSVELARRGHRVDVVGGAPGEMEALLDRSGVAFVPAVGGRALARANLARPRPDVVHAHMTAADVVAVATRPLVRRPVVSTLHFAQRRGHDALTRRMYAVLPHLITVEIAISRTVAEAAGGSPQVILNGVPEPADAGHDVERDPVVLVVQRLEREKDTSTALRAFAASGLAERAWQLHVCGDGSERQRLEDLARDEGIDEATRFLGHVDDPGRRMVRASLLVASAVCEPFGLTVVEAMSRGLPVVATGSGGHRETIGPAAPETLFDPGDHAAAAARLRWLGDDPELRADLAQRAHARYRQVFTIGAHVDALEPVYRRVAGG